MYVYIYISRSGRSARSSGRAERGMLLVYNKIRNKNNSSNKLLIIVVVAIIIIIVVVIIIIVVINY